MTKHLIVYIPMLLWLMGCDKKEILKTSQMEQIRVEENIPAQTSNATIISDRAVVKRFLEAINKGELESIKFSPKWRILITDSKGNVHLVFCSQHEFKYKGETYKSEDDLEKILLHK